MIGQKLACIVPTRFRRQSAKVDLNLWPHDVKSIGFLLSSSATYIWSLKVIWLQLWVCILPTRGFTSSTKVDLWPKINRCPHLNTNNLCLKSASDQAKIVACIVPTRSAKLYLRPFDLKTIGFLLSSSTTYTWSVWTKVVPTRFYTQCQSWPRPLTTLPKINIE